jgi:hypothetical protein
MLAAPMGAHTSQAKCLKMFDYPFLSTLNIPGASRGDKDKMGSVFDPTTGLIFFSTPFRGAEGRRTRCLYDLVINCAEPSHKRIGPCFLEVELEL